MFNTLIFYWLPRPSTHEAVTIDSLRNSNRAVHTVLVLQVPSVQSDSATFRLSLDRLDENDGPTGICHHHHLATVHV